MISDKFGFNIIEGILQLMRGLFPYMDRTQRLSSFVFVKYIFGKMFFRLGYFRASSELLENVISYMRKLDESTMYVDSCNIVGEYYLSIGQRSNAYMFFDLAKSEMVRYTEKLESDRLKLKIEKENPIKNTELDDAYFFVKLKHLQIHNKHAEGLGFVIKAANFNSVNIDTFDVERFYSDMGEAYLEQGQIDSFNKTQEILKNLSSL